MEYSKHLHQYLFSTSGQQVLNLLVHQSEKQFTEKEITTRTAVKKSAVNLALHWLVQKKLVQKERIGRTALYTAAKNNIVIKEIRILQNILRLYPLIEKLKPECQKIILFGSGAQGTNTNESDIDLFVQSNDTDIVKKIILTSSLKDNIQLLVKTPKEMLLINKRKPLLYQEIERGKTLWEQYEE